MFFENRTLLVEQKYDAFLLKVLLENTRGTREERMSGTLRERERRDK